MVDENAQAAVETTKENTDQELESLDVNETTTNDETAQDVVDSNEDVSNEESEETPNETDVPNESESQDEESNEDESDDDEEQFVPISKLRKVRSEAKNLRERLREAESLLADRDDSKLQAQVDSLIDELRTERLANHLTPKVQAAGAIDPEILIGLVHLDSVEWKDNIPSNVDTLIDDLKGKYPKQFKAANGNGNVGTRNEPKGKLEGLNSQQLLSEAYSRTT